MQQFSLVEPQSQTDAVRLGAEAGATFMAGGTDLMQLWKNDVEQPRSVVDIARLKLDAIEVRDNVLHLGALATMADAAANPLVGQNAPAIAQALLLSASPQIRNMGTLGGNLLQRTRCFYFRDTGFACNKRVPGSGCPAIAGENRDLAILGTSTHCIATHPSDMPVALIALDASVRISGTSGDRVLKLADLYREPGTSPSIETSLHPGDLITSIEVPLSSVAKRSTYIKVRDRESFAFALVSVAAAMTVDSGIIKDVRLAAGGVGSVPWRLTAVERALRAKPLSTELIRQAAMAASDGAAPQSKNGFKVTLLQNTVRRALQSLAA